MKKQNTAQNERRTLKKFLARYYEVVTDDPQKGIGVHKSKSISGKNRNRLPKKETGTENQKKEVQKIIHQIILVLDFLPPKSTERKIMELRHLEFKTWTQIQRAVYLSKSPCYEYYRKGLDRLLSETVVRKIIGL